MAKVILKFKDALIKEYEVDKPSIRIGRREGNDIRIDNLAVSGNHAKIQKVDGAYIIVDLKSTNGTFVNRKKIVQAKLHHMDEITIGKHTLIFEDETQPPREAEEPSDEAVAEGPAAPPPTAREERPREAHPTQEMPLARIQFLEPRDQPEVTLHKKLTIIGRRDDADIRLKGLFEPKVAALINRKPSGYSILPEEKVKVKVNGELITRQTELSDGDVIEVGSLKLLFNES
jgi:pSer/pThr/pTyr-binding forkhead associated (FHA) protein